MIRAYAVRKPKGGFERIEYDPGAPGPAPMSLLSEVERRSQRPAYRLSVLFRKFPTPGDDETVVEGEELHAHDRRRGQTGDLEIGNGHVERPRRIPRARDHGHDAVAGPASKDGAARCHKGGAAFFLRLVHEKKQADIIAP